MKFRKSAISAPPRNAKQPARARAARWTHIGSSLAVAFSGLMLALPSQAAKAPPGVFKGAPVGRPLPVPAQFDFIGFIQEARLDTNNVLCTATDPKLRGGWIKVNGREIVVPCNTVLQMPATSLTWAELFDPSLVDPTVVPTTNPPMTGLALADKVRMPVAAAMYPYNAPMPSYEVRVQGNVVDGRHIAGLIFISQQSLNVGQGTINCIDYVNAELHLGGAPGVCSTADTRVRINDPVGRFGKSHGRPGSGAQLIEVGYDKRFTADTDNPTVSAETGYPMCIPRKNPFGTEVNAVHNGFDPECPQSNRPLAPYCNSLPAPFPAFVTPPDGEYCHTWVMDPPEPANCAATSSCQYTTDPTKQAPFAIGDVVDYSGNLKVDAKGPYVSAHTITARLGIFTKPGTRPAYVGIEEMLQGTGALPIANLPQEATSRLLFVGFSTDPSTMVDLYAIDVDPITGETTDRLLGTANPSGPPVLGRFTFKPNAGAYLPATKELRVVSRSMCSVGSMTNNWAVCSMPGDKQVWWGGIATVETHANGLVAGQYRAPNFEFIFPENTLAGDPTVPGNFQDLPFLYCGSGPLSTMTVAAGSTGPVVGQLDPAPWAAPMNDPAFASVLCPSAKTVATPVQPASGPAQDAISVTTAQYDNSKNRGQISVVAIDTHTATVPGLQLYIQMGTSTYDIMAGAAVDINFSPAPQPMTLVKNVPGSPAVCPGTDPCWTYNAQGVINSPMLPGTFLAPTSITITSNLGAKVTVPAASIQVRVR
ncbi:MAG: hypothetical protein RLZZ584_2163 [Pseudomonadota bacterium]|jgi:hypothetical protein